MKNTKKLVGAIAALAVSAALATGTTYAWFATSGVATVDSFDAQVTTVGTNLEVAAIPSSDSSTNVTSLDYKSTLKADYIWSAIVGSSSVIDGISGSISTYSDIKLDALTTASKVTTAGVTATALNDSAPKTYDEKISSPFTLYTNSNNTKGTALTPADTLRAYSAGAEGAAATKATGSYLKFDLVFRSTAASQYLTLNYNSKATSEGVDTTPVTAFGGIDETSYGDVEKDITDGNDLGVQAANALRVAFVNSGNLSTDGTYTVTGGSNAYWAPNEYSVNGLAKDDEGATKRTDVNGTGSCYAGYYKGNLGGVYNWYRGVDTNFVKKQVALPSGLALAQSDATECPATYIGQMGNTKLDSGSYYYFRTTVYIWIEGTDGDCFDAVLGDSITTLMCFQAFDSVAS